MGLRASTSRSPTLGCDFAGWSVHKWTAAPLGTGAMYIRKSRIDDIDIAYDNHEAPPHDVAARVPAGTVDFAAILTIPAAAEFHFAVGGAAKEKHLRSLRNRWVDKVRDLTNVEICVSGRSCSLLRDYKFSTEGHADLMRMPSAYSMCSSRSIAFTLSGERELRRGRLSVLHQASTTRSRIAMRWPRRFVKSTPCSCRTL